MNGKNKKMMDMENHFFDHDHYLIFLVSNVVLGLKQHYLWGHVGGMPCLSVANMPQMIPKFVLA
jgi:hypothetical protein